MSGYSLLMSETKVDTGKRDGIRYFRVWLLRRETDGDGSSQGMDLWGGRRGGGASGPGTHNILRYVVCSGMTYGIRFRNFASQYHCLHSQTAWRSTYASTRLAIYPVFAASRVLTLRHAQVLGLGSGRGPIS